MSFYNLEDLEVYQLAESFGDEIWSIVNEWEFFAKDTVGKQMVRSADPSAPILRKVMEDIIIKRIRISAILAEGRLWKPRVG